MGLAHPRKRVVVESLGPTERGNDAYNFLKILGEYGPPLAVRTNLNWSKLSYVNADFVCWRFRKGLALRVVQNGEKCDAMVFLISSVLSPNSLAECKKDFMRIWNAGLKNAPNTAMLFLLDKLDTRGAMNPKDIVEHVLGFRAETKADNGDNHGNCRFKYGLGTRVQAMGINLLRFRSFGLRRAMDWLSSAAGVEHDIEESPDLMLECDRKAKIDQVLRTCLSPTLSMLIPSVHRALGSTKYEPIFRAPSSRAGRRSAPMPVANSTFIVDSE